MDSTLWWILAILVVLVVVAAIAWAATRNRRVEAQREKAEELRAEAAEHDRELREQEGRVEEVRARAQQARAEADQRAAEAKRLEADAERHDAGLDGVRERREERLREADARDPDIETDRDGFRVGEQDNRGDGHPDDVTGRQDATGRTSRS